MSVASSDATPFSWDEYVGGRLYFTAESADFCFSSDADMDHPFPKLLPKELLEAWQERWSQGDLYGAYFVALKYSKSLADRCIAVVDYSHDHENPNYLFPLSTDKVVREKVVEFFSTQWSPSIADVQECIEASDGDSFDRPDSAVSSGSEDYYD